MNAAVPFNRFDDILSDEAVADPYTFFARLREHDPIYWNARYSSWVMTGYEDVSEVFRDPRFSSDRITPYVQNRIDPDSDIGRVFHTLGDWLVFKDPPDHTRLRRLVQRAFTPRAVQRMRAKAEQIASQLLDDVASRGRCDLIQSYAYPLPAIIIADMLGVPTEDRDAFKGWSDDLSALVFGALEDPQRHERAISGMRELTGYLNHLIAHYRDFPDDNLISALINAEEEGDALSSDEVLATCTLLLFGGHETTTNYIANGILALLQNPDQLDQYLGDPNLRGPAGEEMLRFDGPAKVVVRVVSEDHERNGHRFLAGQRVFLAVAGANRDPGIYSDPDRFDIRRDGRQNLGFGYGIHYCLGAPLARLEGSVAIPLVFERLRQLKIDGDLTWNPVILTRSLTALPVSYESAR